MSRCQESCLVARRSPRNFGKNLSSSQRPQIQRFQRLRIDPARFHQSLRRPRHRLPHEKPRPPPVIRSTEYQAVIINNIHVQP